MRFDPFRDNKRLDVACSILDAAAFVMLENDTYRKVKGFGLTLKQIVDQRRAINNHRMAEGIY